MRVNCGFLHSRKSSLFPLINLLTVNQTPSGDCANKLGVCVFPTVNTINQHVTYTFFVQFHNAFIIHTVWLSQKPITPRHICFWWNVHCVYFRNACTGCSERRIKQSIWLFRLSKHTQMHIISSIIYFLRRQLEEQTHWMALIVFEYSKVNLSSRGNKVQLLSYS